LRILTGHQPVYLPWLGLIHKASLADIFILMDDVKYLEQDWNNRNCIKSPQGEPIWLTVPVDIKKSSSKKLKDIRINDEKQKSERKRWQNVHWSSIRMAYGKSNFFKKYSSFFEWLYLEKKWRTLTDLNLAILRQIFEWFDIRAEIVIASDYCFKQKKSDLVIEHGLRFNADIIVTGINGKNYMDTDKAEKNGIKIVFQEYEHPRYVQRFGNFLSHLSFIDLLFNNGPDSKEICLRNNLTRENICSLMKL